MSQVNWTIRTSSSPLTTATTQVRQEPSRWPVQDTRDKRFISPSRSVLASSGQAAAVRVRHQGSSHGQRPERQSKPDQSGMEVICSTGGKAAVPDG